MSNLTRVAAQSDSLVEGRVGPACEDLPQPDMLAAVGAYPVRLFKGEVLAPSLEEKGLTGASL